MYKYIVNPITNRKVKINGNIGRQVIKKYLKQYGGITTFHIGGYDVDTLCTDEGTIDHSNIIANKDMEGCNQLEDMGMWNEISEELEEDILIICGDGSFIEANAHINEILYESEGVDDVSIPDFRIVIVFSCCQRSMINELNAKTSPRTIFVGFKNLVHIINNKIYMCKLFSKMNASCIDNVFGPETDSNLVSDMNPDNGSRFSSDTCTAVEDKEACCDSAYNSYWSIFEREITNPNFMPDYLTKRNCKVFTKEIILQRLQNIKRLILDAESQPDISVRNGLTIFKMTDGADILPQTNAGPALYGKCNNTELGT